MIKKLTLKKVNLANPFKEVHRKNSYNQMSLGIVVMLMKMKMISNENIPLHVFNKPKLLICIILIS